MRDMDEVETAADSGEFAAQQLFAGLDADARLAVDEIAEVCTIEPGREVFAQGDPADGIYSVVAGSLSVWICNGDDRQRVATLGVGSTFGEMAFIDGRPRSTTIVADTTVVVKRLTEASLTALEARVPQVRSVLFANLARDLSSRLRDANDEIRALA